MSKMISTDVIIKAQFYDLDPMQIVWHGNYPKFFEQARCALLEQLNFGYIQMAETQFSWPIVDMRIKYVRPIKFRQEVRVTATLLEYESRIRIRYRIIDMLTDEVLTKAETLQFAVDNNTGNVCLDSPKVLIERVKELL